MKSDTKFYGSLFLLAILAIPLWFVVYSIDSHGQTMQQIGSVKELSQDGVTTIRVVMKGDPARTFVATYPPRTELSREHDLLKKGEWVILKYHGSIMSEDQTIDSIEAWRNHP